MDVYHKLKKLDQSQLSNIYYNLNNKKITKDITRSRLIRLILKPLKPKYKMETHKEKKIKDRILPFTFQEGQTVQLLNSKSFPEHIGIKIIKSGKKPIIFGFYPKGGYMKTSVFYPQKGEIWTPDPYLKKGNYRTLSETKLTGPQAKKLRNIINKDNCNLKKGSTGIRLECPTTSYYTMIPTRFSANKYNCRTYVTTLFPDFEKKLPSLI